MQKKLAHGEEKKPPPRTSAEDPAGQGGAAAGGASSLDQLRRALREVVGSGAAEQPEPPEAEAEAARAGTSTHSHRDLRAQRERPRPSASFLTTSRADVAKLDIGNRFRAPPPGTYQPKSDLSEPRVLGQVDFGAKEETVSRRTLAIQREVQRLKEEGLPYDHLIKDGVSVELLDYVPEKVKPRLRVVDLTKNTGRPDLIKAAGIHYHVNTFTDGVLDGDLHCSQSQRKPAWDFAKLSVAQPKLPETYFQPGQYNVNLEAVRPRLETKNIPFEKRPARQPLREVVGRVEIKSRAGDHLPDRSLARSCPNLSSRTRVIVPDISKYTKRPPFWKNAPVYHREEDPEIDQAVQHHSLTVNVVEADKVLRRRARSVEGFSQSLKREQQLKVQRRYGEDVCLQLAKENLSRGPVSVELLPEVGNSPSLRRRVTAPDFGQMPGRETDMKHVVSPSRRRDPGGAAKFERNLRPGDLRVEVQQLSQMASGISELRATRSYQALERYEPPE